MVKQLEKAGFPTTVMVLDFESFFSDEYTLSKMSTVEYVCDPRFELTGLGVQILDSIESEFIPVDDIDSYIAGYLQDQFGLDLGSCTVVCQNCKFDCLILKERFRIIPPYTIDIVDLDRFWDARDKHNLAHMAKKWKAPSPKGDTKKFKGYHWKDMSSEMQEALKEYCVNDVEIETFLFKKLLPLIVNPEIELPLATQTLRLFLEPQFKIDMDFGRELKRKMEAEMLKSIEALRELGIDADHEDISGNKKFAELLNAQLPGNEQIPMKEGKNGLIPALAQADEGMHRLLNHEKPEIQGLAKARLAVKSWPLHISRVTRLMNQAKARGGMLGSPLSYYAGHTGRWGGTEKVNLQNLGGRGRSGKGVHSLIGQIRQMLTAPDDCTLGIVDFAQIEARILAWLAGQNDLLQGFAQGQDVYSKFATELFQSPVRKAKESDPAPVQKLLTIRRGFGKDAILGAGYGMGATKFYERCRANEDLRSAFDTGKYDFQFVQKLIWIYRNKYAKIPEFWREVEKAWRFVTKYTKEVVGLPWPTLQNISFKHVPLHYYRDFHQGSSTMLKFYHQDDATFIQLPSGRFLRYPHASINKKDELLYRWGSLWGGSITENIVQAVARDIFAEALLRIDNYSLHTHDDIVCIFHKSNAEEELQQLVEQVEIVPVWANGLPIAVESKLSERYLK